MTPVLIGEIIVFVLWIFNFLMVQWTRKIGDFNESNFFLSLEIMCLGFMWIFVGFGRGWW